MSDPIYTYNVHSFQKEIRTEITLQTILKADHNSRYFSYDCLEFTPQNLMFNPKCND